MHDHRTGPSGSNKPPSDSIATEAAEGITALEQLLANASRPVESLWAREGRVAQTISEQAYDAARGLPADSELRAQLLDQAEDWSLLASMRGQTRFDQYVQAKHLSESAVGILNWKHLPLELRRKLHHQGIHTIDRVRDLASRPGELRAIQGIGPTRERKILEALTITDAERDRLR